MLLSEIENKVVTLLADKGPISGTAQVAYALWPDRQMQPQGAAVAAGGILRRLQTMGFIERYAHGKLTRYEATPAGQAALASDLHEAIEVRAREAKEFEQASKDRKTKKAASAASWV